MSKKKSPTEPKYLKRPADSNILEKYSPYRVGKILATSTKKKEDVFETFIPKKGICLDYNVSETFLKMDAGNTKITIKDTIATYVPTPLDMLKPPKRNEGMLFGHGYPPQWIFVDEIWLEKMNALQEKYKRELRAFLRRRKKERMLQGRDKHNAIQSLVGPEWYQELSPRQLRTVDRLQCCILKDAKDNTIINTQENIGCLGLVLRPNQRHVQLALVLCCKCPIEFLLILYQLINPKRSHYSLNDRLLLSAVVHLTMRETLRELHIRLPSPPKPEKIPGKPPKKSKEPKYESPYLKPYTFKPEPRKFTGIYVNKHVQYPESPYFDYLKFLTVEKSYTEDILEMDLSNLEEEERGLLEDLKEAQRIYNKLQKKADVRLVRPTLSNKFRNSDALRSALYGKSEKNELILPPLVNLNDLDAELNTKCECAEIAEDLKEDEDIYPELDFLKQCECSRQCKPECDCKLKSKLYTTPKCTMCIARANRKHIHRVIGGLVLSRSNNWVPMITGTVPPKTCNCLQQYKDKLIAVVARNRIKSHRSSFVIGGIAMTSNGPVYILSTALRKKKRKDTVSLVPATDVKEKTGSKSVRVVCETDKKEEQKPEVKKRKLDPYDCTCGRNVGEEESSDEESTSSSTEAGSGDACKKCTPICAKGKAEKGVKANGDRKAKKGRGYSSKKCICGKQSDTCCDFEFSKPCECQEECDCKEEAKRFTDNKCEVCMAKLKQALLERIIAGMKKTSSNNVVPIIGGTRLQRTCDCLQIYKDKLVGIAARNKIKCQKAQFIIGGVVMTGEGPVYILSAVVGKMTHEDNSKGRCTCKTKKDVKKTVPKKRVPKKKSIDDILEDEGPFTYSSCRCKEELEKFLAHKCTCEKCNIAERQRTATYIKAGVKYTESGQVVNIVQGVRSQRCDCLQKHLEKIAKLEQYRKRIEARYRLRSQSCKYSIGGVVNTPEGPIYVITGMRPPVECVCAKVARQRAEEELRLSRMPQVPPTGRIKYQISGVRQTPDGNVFILSQALAIDDCDCMKLYNTFEQAHKTCLDSYEQFLKQMQETIDEFMKEAEDTYNKREETNDDLAEVEEEEKVEDEENEKGEDKEEDKEEEKDEDKEEEKDEGNETEDAAEDVKEEIEEKKEDAEIEEEEQDDKEEKRKKKSPKICSCQEDSDSSSSESSDIDESEEDVDEDGQKVRKSKDGKRRRKSKGSSDDSDESDESDTSSTVSIMPIKLVKSQTDALDEDKEGGDKDNESEDFDVEEKSATLKRFIILRKIPCKYNEQKEIIQKLLTGLAEDGFQLAKLPDCYKLPHFKLWMQLRCGLFWTQKDRKRYELFSKEAWCHTDKCQKAVPRPQLGIDKAKASKMTWQHAAFIRRIVTDKVGMYYRLVRQENIEWAREFFPLTFSYEFPTPTFRDCYFAYLPAKEEDVLVYRIVKPHEARVNLKKFPCY